MSTAPKYPRIYIHQNHPPAINADDVDAVWELYFAEQRIRRQLKVRLVALWVTLVCSWIIFAIVWGGHVWGNWHP